MTAKQVQEVLGARVLVGSEYLDQEVKTACGSDLMSDVLAFSKDHSVLLTGLCWISCALFLSGGRRRTRRSLRWPGTGG